MLNSRKRRSQGEASSFRPLGTRPQVSFKWGAQPRDPFEEEAKRQRLHPPERLMADTLAQYKNALRHEASHSKDPARQIAVESYLANSELPRNFQDLLDRESEQFTKDFMCWLQGKHPKSKADPAYVSHRLKQYGVKPDHGPLHGPGIDEFLGSVVSKKADLHRKIALLAMGPDKAFPWTLEHYWLFYKYLLRDKPYLEDEMLPDFDMYWPNEQMGRPYKRFKGLGDTQWSSYGGRHAAEMKVHDTCDTVHEEDKANDNPEFSKMHNASHYTHRPVVPPDSPADPEAVPASSAAPAPAIDSSAASEHTTISTVPIVPVDANAPELPGPVAPVNEAPPPELPTDPSPEPFVPQENPRAGELAAARQFYSDFMARKLAKTETPPPAPPNSPEAPSSAPPAPGSPSVAEHKSAEQEYEDALAEAEQITEELDKHPEESPEAKAILQRLDGLIKKAQVSKERMSAAKGEYKA